MKRIFILIQWGETIHDLTSLGASVTSGDYIQACLDAMPLIVWLLPHIVKLRSR